MGNYKFRLADMMPNAWFYKLRDMSNKKPRNQKLSTSTHSQSLDQQKIKKKKKKNTTFPNSSSSSNSSPSTTTTTTVSFKPSLPYSHSPRKSYYFTRDYPNSPKRHPISPQEHQTQSQTQNQILLESPRRSSSKNKMRKRRQSSKQCQKQLSVRDDRNSLSSEYSPEKEYSDEREFRCDKILPTDTKTCSCHDRENCKENDIVIDVDGLKEELFDNNSFSKVELPPIVTKPSAKAIRKREKHSVNSSALKNSTITRTVASNSTTNSCYNNTNTTTNSPGFRVRINNSPRIATKRFSGFRKSASSSSSSGNSRSSKSLSDSFAVVKTSFDPQRDFRESMVEMIVENNIRDSKDLEDLLACYLSLNSDEYHGVIIKVFKQIWFDLTDIN